MVSMYATVFKLLYLSKEFKILKSDSNFVMEIYVVSGSGRDIFKIFQLITVFIVVLKYELLLDVCPIESYRFQRLVKFFWR